MSTVWTETFTPNEAAALTELSEGQVRKELEYRVIEASSPPRIPFTALVYLRALKKLSLQLKVDDRQRVARCVLSAIKRSKRIDAVSVGEIVVLQLGPLVRELVTRTQRFERWKAKLVTDPKIMAGEAVFPRSRLTVRRIGEMLVHGESPDEIREDYPYLTDEDLELAQVYVRAYPRVGRPPAATPAD